MGLEAVQQTFNALVNGSTQIAAVNPPRYLKFLYLYNASGALGYFRINYLPSASVVLTNESDLTFGLSNLGAIYIEFPGQGLKVKGTGLTFSVTATRNGSTTAAMHVAAGWY